MGGHLCSGLNWESSDGYPLDSQSLLLSSKQGMKLSTLQLKTEWW